jgi:hypothetical protein
MAMYRLLILASLTFNPPIFLLILQYVPWSLDLSFPMVIADDFGSWETLVLALALPVVLLSPLLLFSCRSLSRLPP